MTTKELQELAKEAYPAPSERWSMDLGEFQQRERKNEAKRDAYMAGILKALELVAAASDELVISGQLPTKEVLFQILRQ